MTGVSPPPRILSEERIQLRSVGVDIGSATSHLVFSVLTMRKIGSRFVTVARDVVYQSPILLTPYLADFRIDSDALGAFVTVQYEAAGLVREEIDTGALILTGVALLRENARSIAELFAEEAGRFVAVSAGDNLESVMAAYGSGAVATSAARRCRVLNVDLGGGTTKLTVCDGGRIEATQALDVGARLLVDGPDGSVARLEPAGKSICARLGVPVRIGTSLADADRQAVAEYMVAQVLAAAPIGGGPASAGDLQRGEPLSGAAVDVVVVSGGVAEYFYGREDRRFGDLAPLLASVLRRELEAQGTEVLDTGKGIRATVLGASQYTAQVSGSTIYVSEPSVLPLRNVPVVVPDLGLDDDPPDEDKVAAAVAAALVRFDLTADESVALAVRWAGSATFERLQRLAGGMRSGLLRAGHRCSTVVVVCDDDVGRLIGKHLVEELGTDYEVVSVDCIHLTDFDFVDVGLPLPGASVVPVVVKSLMFPDPERVSV